MIEPFPDTTLWCKCNSPGETLDDIQVEAFAVVREAARRTLGMRHFDVQVRPALVPDFFTRQSSTECVALFGLSPCLGNQLRPLWFIMGCPLP